MAIERSFAKVWRWLSPAIGVLLVAGAVMAVPFAIPLLPVETFLRYQRALGMAPHRTEAVELGELPQQYADMFGWPEMAACVADVYTRLQPAERTVCGILAADYGEAGAIDFFGRAKGLPPVLCSHQSYFLWGPGKRSGQVMIAVGMSQAFVEKHFEQVELAAVFQHPYAIPDENNLPIYVCRGLKAPSLAAVWPSLKRWR